MLRAKATQQTLGGVKHRHSVELFERGQRVISGGIARLAARQIPYPIYHQSGDGVLITDVDGNRYLDFLNNFTSLIHGHSYPPVVEAVRLQVERGLCFSGPSEAEIELAELLCGRVPGFEQVRFMNTGTEAVMNAIKAARAFTGRAKIAKVEGAYHGSYEPVEMSLDSNPDNWGDDDAPIPVPVCKGIPSSVVHDTVILPFNDLEATRKILIAHKEELAAVLIDPLPQGAGLVPIDPNYLAYLRDFTSISKSLLVCDDVMSFRLSFQGGLKRFGFEADLCAFGKIIGGGMAIGAVAGPARFMSAFDPSKGKPMVPQSGTFTANPMSMVAGAAAMRGFTRDACARLEQLGDYAVAELRRMFKREGWPYSVTGLASLFRIHLRADPPRNYREASLDAGQRRSTTMHFVRLLQDNGVLVSPTCQFCLSTPMTRDHIDEMVCRVHRSLETLGTP